jgi:hypothetical protein
MSDLVSPNEKCINPYKEMNINVCFNANSISVVFFLSVQHSHVLLIRYETFIPASIDTAIPPLISDVFFLIRVSAG